MAKKGSRTGRQGGLGALADRIVKHQLLAPYYVLNGLFILSWVVVRMMMLSGAPDFFRLTMSRWERQGFWAVCLTVAVKLWQAPTIEAFFARTFIYVEFVVLLLAWMLDLRLFGWYCVLFAVLYLTCSQPLYSGPGDVHLLTQRALEDIVSSGGKGSAWMVFLYTHWSPPCMHVYRTFSDLSLRYSHAGLKFGRFDIGRWSSAAEAFRVDLGVFAQGVPAIVLIEEGREAGRLPRTKRDGTPLPTRMLAGEIAREFQLDMRLMRNRSRVAALGGQVIKRTESKAQRKFL